VFDGLGWMGSDMGCPPPQPTIRSGEHPSSKVRGRELADHILAHFELAEFICDMKLDILIILSHKKLP